MNFHQRLSQVFQSAPIIPFDDASQLVLMSDCHRGDGSWADDLLHNQGIYLHVLDHYYRLGYTYLELGDGDELWENWEFRIIRRIHADIFSILRRFYEDNRFYLLYGNHDCERKDPRKVAKTLYQFRQGRSGKTIPLFPEIVVHEGLTLQYTPTHQKIFLVHGHQCDPLVDHFWRFDRWMARVFWRRAQLLGINDTTRAAINYKKRDQIENRLVEWILENQQPLVAGHTHRPRFPSIDDPPFFNSGCCVHPQGITCIEICTGQIQLVKWYQSTRADGVVIIKREQLDSPRSIGSIFEFDRVTSTGLSNDRFDLDIE